MEGLDQNIVVSSKASGKHAKTVISLRKTVKPVSQSVKRNTGDCSNSSHPDPTRFDDWEHAGRCIDFWRSINLHQFHITSVIKDAN